ncbi:PAS domain-containing protein [Ideonella sp. 4Y16]|uniref:sensor domain-containing diguanylate cyclase n=1 Tax=Ideonella alba TaxID=2824118 RepID=UPI001B38E1D7|nr:PAS domain-containing protein [Ideonella alba]MBQ0942212.1 PAS domain-containing protein [Ideonella alba]
MPGQDFTSDLTAETRRIERLRALLVLDTEAEPIFDTLAQMASEVCQTPIALLSLVDSGRQWFKANVGLPGVRETPRSVAFCDHAIRGDQPMEVPDALKDSRFADNPLVIGAPGIRYYAGAPLVMSSGDRVGTLCVVDLEARKLTQQQLKILEQLAQLTVQALEMRERSIQRSLELRSAREREVAASEQRLRAILDAQSELVSQALPDGQLLYVNPAYASFFGHTVGELAGANLMDQIPASEREAVRARLDALLAAGGSQRSENQVTAADGQVRCVSWTNTVQQGPDGRLLLHSTGRDVTELNMAQRALAQSQALLERTGRVAGVGGWAMDLATQRVSWTAETRRIHEVPPDYEPSLETAIAFYSESSRPLVTAAVERGLAEGTPWDLELQLVTARGRSIWVRAVGEVEFADGHPVRMFGAFQDITERRAAEAARAELAAIFENTTDFVIQADASRRVRYMNPAAQAVMLGRPLSQDEGLFVRDMLPERTQRKFTDEILPYLQLKDVWVGQSVARRWDGREIEVSHMVIAHRDARGEIERLSIIFRDVSELAAAQYEQARQTRTLRSVANAIPSTVAVIDDQGRYVFVNQAFEKKAGIHSSAILGRTAEEVLGKAEFERRWPWVQRALAGEQVRFEIEEEGELGKRFMALDYLPLRRSDGAPDGFVVVGQDVTQAREEKERLKLLSQSDPLTRLLNRSGFQQRVDAQLDANVAETLCVMYLDLDRFKPINDNHGHAAGDELLRLVALRLVRLVRPTDAVARLGGDEFAIAIVGEIDELHAQRLSRTVVDTLARRFHLAGGVVASIGTSVGCAIGQATRGSWERLVEHADQMLYAAKASGRGKTVVSRLD